MSNSIKIKKSKMDIGEAKDIEYAEAMAEDWKAFMDYIAVCDHPEILEDDVEALREEE